jgi:hypothetical protein
VKLICFATVPTTNAPLSHVTLLNSPNKENNKVRCFAATAQFSSVPVLGRLSLMPHKCQAATTTGSRTCASLPPSMEPAIKNDEGKELNLTAS